MSELDEKATADLLALKEKVIAIQGNALNYLDHLITEIDQEIVQKLDSAKKERSIT